MGRTKIGAVVMLSALALAACGSSTTTSEKQPTKPHATEVTVFAPTADDGSSTVKPTKVLDGSCWTTSIGSSRQDGYRCSAGHEIYDPCFVVDPGKPQTRVLCMNSPFDRDAVELKIPDLPEADASDVGGTPEDGNPWALVLESGQRCESTGGGATSAVNGQRLNYVCGKDLALYGEPDRTTATWTIYGRHGDETQLKRVPIAHAYF